MSESQNPTHHLQKIICYDDYHNSAFHVSVLASMIASENLTFTHNVSTKTIVRKHRRAKSFAMLFDWMSGGKDTKVRLGDRQGACKTVV